MSGSVAGAQGQAELLLWVEKQIFEVRLPGVNPSLAPYQLCALGWVSASP